MLTAEGTRFNREVYIPEGIDTDRFEPADIRALCEIGTETAYRLVTRIEGEQGIILASSGEQNYSLFTPSDDAAGQFTQDGERYTFSCPVTEYHTPRLYQLASSADR